MYHFISVAFNFCRVLATFRALLHNLLYGLMKLFHSFFVIIQCSVRELRGKLRKRSFCAAARINERTSRRPIDCTNSISPAWSRLFPDGARVELLCEPYLCVEYPRQRVLLVISRIGIRWGDHQWNHSCGQLKNIDTMLIAMQSIDASWPIDRGVEIYIITRKIFYHKKKRKLNLFWSVANSSENFVHYTSNLRARASEI